MTATAGNGSATVSWSAPSNGGSTITSYTVTPYIGSEAQPATTVTGSPAATSTTITGLANGTGYTFTVTATNAAGSGPASEHSGAATPATTPSAPTSVTASAENGSATVTWIAPSNGGSTITSYTITPYIGSEAQPATTVTGSPPATSATVTGLSNGTSYTFTVQASNPNGSGPTSSASNAVTPARGAGRADRRDGDRGQRQRDRDVDRSVERRQPDHELHGHALHRLEAQPSTTVTGSPPATSTTITGLSNGTSYTFTVTATNDGRRRTGLGTLERRHTARRHRPRRRQ